MINKKLAAEYEQACRNAEFSKIRLAEAEKNSDDYSEEDLSILRREVNEDEKNMITLQKQLRDDIACISDVTARRLAEDHYIRNEKIITLAVRYRLSESTIKRYLQKARRE